MNRVRVNRVLRRFSGIVPSEAIRQMSARTEISPAGLAASQDINRKHALAQESGTDLNLRPPGPKPGLTKLLHPGNVQPYSTQKAERMRTVARRQVNSKTPSDKDHLPWTRSATTLRPLSRPSARRPMFKNENSISLFSRSSSRCRPSGSRLSDSLSTLLPADHARHLFLIDSARPFICIAISPIAGLRCRAG